MVINGRGSKPGDLNGRELVVGRQPVLEALRCGTVTRIYLLEGQKGRIIGEIKEAAAAAGIPLSTEKREVFDRRLMEQRGHQGVAALARPFRYLSLAELLEQAGSAGDPLFLLLDHLQDPQNLGSIIRTVHCAGVEGIIIPERRAVPVTPAVRKVSAGAAERARVALVGNLARALEQLKEAGFWVYGVEVDGEESIFGELYQGPLVLVFGSEGKGLSPLLRRHCDRVLYIPMAREAASLNVGAAVAITVYNAVARRRGWL